MTVLWRLVATVLDLLFEACDALGRWESRRRWDRRFDPQDRERVGL